MTSKLPESSRRTVVKQGLGLGLSLTGVAQEAVAKAVEGYQPVTLTLDEVATLKALMGRLIPADGTGGGAAEACAYIYVDRVLGTFYARYLNIYRDGLAELDRWAKRERHNGFAAMPADKMDALIARMEKGELTGGIWADGGRAFFNLARTHTAEGFLSDPMYGGNKDFIGWKLVGFKGPQLNYPAETQRLDGKDQRAPRSIADFGGSPIR